MQIWWTEEIGKCNESGVMAFLFEEASPVRNGGRLMI